MSDKFYKHERSVFWGRALGRSGVGESGGSLKLTYSNSDVFLPSHHFLTPFFAPSFLTLEEDNGQTISLCSFEVFKTLV